MWRWDIGTMWRPYPHYQCRPFSQMHLTHRLILELSGCSSSYFFFLPAHIPVKRIDLPADRNVHRHRLPSPALDVHISDDSFVRMDSSDFQVALRFRSTIVCHQPAECHHLSGCCQVWAIIWPKFFSMMLSECSNHKPLALAHSSIKRSWASSICQLAGLPPSLLSALPPVARLLRA